MIIQDYFLKLPVDLKDKFCKELTDLGVIFTMNPMEYNHRLRSLIASTATPIKLKRLYRFMLNLSERDRNKFFNNFVSDL
jgi:hypothetical protein